MVIAKTLNLMYTLNMQVIAYGQQTVPDRGVVRSCDPLEIFRASIIITGRAEHKLVKCCTQVGYVNFSNRMAYHPQKRHVYGHVTRRAGLSATAEVLVEIEPDIDRESPIWTYPTSKWRSRSGWPRRNFAVIFGVRKLESLVYRMALFAWS